MDKVQIQVDKELTFIEKLEELDYTTLARNPYSPIGTNCLSRSCSRGRKSFKGCNPSTLS